VIEVLIAVFVDDNFIRPYFGDFLVVILLYCFLKTFWNISVKMTALFVLLFAFTIEVLQYLKFVKFVGLQDSKVANVVLGNSFAWSDIIAYTLGVLAVLAVEFLASTEKSR
jgi:glycopeptide antibiotics resistance protein